MRNFITKHRIDIIVLALVFLTIVMSHYASSNITSFDSRWSIHTAFSIIREGNTDLDEYKSLLEKDNYYAVKEINGHYYNIFPIGVSLLSLPFVYVISKGLPILLATAPWLEQHFRSRMTDPSMPIDIISIHPLAERFIASLVVGLTAALIYLIARHFLGKSYSMVIVFIFAFCTSAWSTASRALWQHGPSMLLLTSTLYMILTARDRPRLTPYASLPLALSYVVRPTNIISVVLLTVFMLIRYKQCFLLYILLAMTIAVPFVLYNFSVYHSLLSPYYGVQRVEVSSTFFEAFAGNLISPSRGLLVFSPIFLFSIYGIVLKMRNGQFHGLDTSLLGIILLHWIFISFFTHWWAGHSFGPRFFSDMTPYLIYFLIPAVCTISKSRGAVKAVVFSTFGFLVVVSFFINYRGATSWDVFLWNGDPTDIDATPARLWDWCDVQFLRGIK